MTLVIHPDLLGKVTDVAPVIEVAALLTDLLKEKPNEPDRVASND